MKARLIQDDAGNLQVLCSDGTISSGTPTMLYNFLVNFRDANRFSGEDGRWADQYDDMSYVPGTTLAFVTDFDALTLSTFTPFVSLLGGNADTFDRVSVEEYAKMHGKSKEIIKVFCRQGRLSGAVKVSNAWTIPRNAPYPVLPSKQKEGVTGPRGPRKPLKKVVSDADDSYISAEEYAKNYDRSVMTVTRYCIDGRIEGAKKVDGSWQIPKNAPYPTLAK